LLITVTSLALFTSTQKNTDRKIKKGKFFNIDGTVSDKAVTKILVFQRSQQPVDSNMAMKMYTLCGFLDVARQFQHLQLR
jgi:hypothetical protein